MNNNAMNKFLFLHQPYWTTSKTWMKKVHPILARHRVTAVFAGRNSDFLKGEKIDGVQYCITGPTAHHLCLITIRPTGWKLALVTPNALHPN
jgi:hypothetical protein